MSTADTELIRSLLAGRREAFAVYFETYFPRVFRFALRRVADPALAEDIAQNTMVKSMSALASFRGEAALLSWLCAICRNEIALERHRRPALPGTPLPIEDDPAIQAALSTIASGEGPEALARRAQLAGVVQSILDALPAVYSDVLEWKYIDELTVDEIAHRLGRGAKATESLLTRARQAFRLAAGDVFDEARP